MVRFKFNIFDKIFILPHLILYSNNSEENTVSNSNNVSVYPNNSSENNSDNTNKDNKNNNPTQKYVKVIVDDPFNNRDIILQVAKKQKGVYLWESLDGNHKYVGHSISLYNPISSYFA